MKSWYGCLSCLSEKSYIDTMHVPIFENKWAVSASEKKTMFEPVVTAWVRT
jgi:hypothetical protein